MDEPMYTLDQGGRELRRRLEAFADLRLSPSASATTRMRAAVMSAAHRRAALIEADATFGAADATWSARERLRVATARSSWRRPVAAMMAGCLTLFILAGTAVAARPGGPLYAARLWTEMANLPAGLIDRAKAEARRLEDRIDEAQVAVTAGDVAAANAAFGAYSAIVAEAALGSRADPQAAAELEPTVARHVTVLTQLLTLVPASARPAAEKALSSGTLALVDLDATDEGAIPGGGSGGAESRPGTAGGHGGGVVGSDPGTGGGTGGGQRPGDGGGGVVVPPGHDKPADKPPKADDPDETDDPGKTDKPAKPANGSSSDPACPPGLVGNDHTKRPCLNHAGR